MDIKIYSSAKQELDKLINNAHSNKNYIRIFIRTLSFWYDARVHLTLDELRDDDIIFDVDGYKIIIQAGKNGWTIIYADYSTDFKDIISSANKNFEEAYNLAVNRLGTLTETIAKEISQWF